MIYCTIGVPCRFSEWCERLLAALLEASGKQAGVFIANGLDEIGRGLLEHDWQNAVVVSRQPQSALCRTLLALNRPVMITLDTPSNAVGALMADHGETYATAVRHVANCLAALMPIMQSENALVLQASKCKDGFAAAKAISEHFALGLAEKTLRSVAKACSPMNVWDAAPPRMPQADDYDTPPILAELKYAASQTALESALTPLWNHICGEALGEIVWHPYLLFLGDAPGEPATKLVDVTGSGRCLIFGPYIRLPEGPWSCNVVFGCSEHAAGLKMIAEVFNGVAVNRVNFEIGETGIFEIEFSFVNSHPDAPIEIRLLSASASFEGEIMIGQVRMFPLKAKRLAVA